MHTFFSPVLVMGRPGLFTFSEVTEIPADLFIYHANFGTVITSEPLPVPEAQIQPDHIELCAGGCHTLRLTT